MIEGHPYNLHPGGIQEPHLVVEAPITAHGEILGGQAVWACARVVQGPLELRAVRQQPHVGHDLVEFVIEGGVRQRDREMLALLEERALVPLADGIGPEHEAAQQGRAGHEEDEKTSEKGRGGCLARHDGPPVRLDAATCMRTLADVHRSLRHARPPWVSRLGDSGCRVRFMTRTGLG